MGQSWNSDVIVQGHSDVIRKIFQILRDPFGRLFQLVYPQF